MTKVFKVPSSKEEFILSNKDIEVLVLPKEVKRLDIKFAPSLKKIISLSDKLVIGPESLKADIPVLNNCNNLNEIITYGTLKFNTMINVNNQNIICAWTGLNEIPPVLTIIGEECFDEFPCYNYQTNVPMDLVDSALIYAYPIIKTCPKEFSKYYIEKSLENPNKVLENKKYAEEDYVFYENVKPVLFSSREKTSKSKMLLKKRNSSSLNLRQFLR